jgi:hypothetical protein
LQTVVRQIQQIRNTGDLHPLAAKDGFFDGMRCIRFDYRQYRFVAEVP